jgi:hypothetical protein
VICPACGTAYWIRRSRGAINLSEMWPDTEDSRRGENAAAVIESRLAEIGELIQQAESEIETLKGREQSPALQKGCAFFGLFLMVVFVVVLFMLLGKGYVGGWLFFSALAAVVLLSLARMRRKLIGSSQLDELRQQRIQLEDGLASLQAERDRILRLKTSLTHQGSNERS